MSNQRIYLREGSHTLIPGQHTGIFAQIGGTLFSIDLDISANGRKYRVGSALDWSNLTVNSYTLILARAPNGSTWLVGMIGWFPSGVILEIVPPIQYQTTATPSVA